MGRIRLSVEERKAEIKKKSIRLFLEKGFNEVDMQEIVNSVGISKGGHLLSLQKQGRDTL